MSTPTEQEKEAETVSKKVTQLVERFSIVQISLREETWHVELAMKPSYMPGYVKGTGATLSLAIDSALQNEKLIVRAYVESKEEEVKSTQSEIDRLREMH